MNNIKKVIITILSTLLFIGIVYSFRMYQIKQINYESMNICQDDALVVKLIEKNINPFNKFKFVKKRNIDCKVLLIKNKTDAEEHHSKKYCSLLNSSTNSVTMLIHTYVHELYDREAASKELKEMIPLMLPYDYCYEFNSNLYDLVLLKKRLGI